MDKLDESCHEGCRRRRSDRVAERKWRIGWQGGLGFHRGAVFSNEEAKHIYTVLLLHLINLFTCE